MISQPLTQKEDHKRKILYDSFNLPVQQTNLEVRQVLQHGKNYKHLKKLEITSDLGFFTVRDLEDHFTQHHHMHSSLAAVLIIHQTSQWYFVLITQVFVFLKVTHMVSMGALLPPVPLEMSANLSNI